MKFKLIIIMCDKNLLQMWQLLQSEVIYNKV